MYTDPEIIHIRNTKHRSYVKVTVSGIRYRFYNGKTFGVACFPNKSDSQAEKLRLLNQLHYELKKKLETGWRPSQPTQEHTYKNTTISQGIATVMTDIYREDISDRYRADLTRVSKEFLKYLRKRNGSQIFPREITPVLIERFLESFKSSAGYYMTKRSTLAGLFTRMVRKGIMDVNPVWKTSRKKLSPILNKIYTKEQLRMVLAHLQVVHPNLYLCALLMYGCFLRPHREIRFLKRKHLNQDCTVITLGGDENKSKRIRVVNLPEYVRRELLNRSVHQLAPEDYVITKSSQVYNADYFKTAWTRMKKTAEGSGLFQDDQSLYSFRHTAAIDVYQRTRDAYKVQQLMGHSSLVVTLTYLRSLGMVNQNDPSDLPEL
jgi:integrase